MDFLIDPAGVDQAALVHRRWWASLASLFLHPFPWQLQAAESQQGTVDQDLVSKDTLLVQQPVWDMQQQSPLDTQGTTWSVAVVPAGAFEYLVASAAVHEAGYAVTERGGAAGYGVEEATVFAEDASGPHTEVCPQGAEKQTSAMVEVEAAADPTSAAAGKRSRTEASAPNRQRIETGWTCDATGRV